MKVTRVLACFEAHSTSGTLVTQMTRPPGPVPGQYANAAAQAAAAASKRPRMDGEPRPPFLHGPAPMLAPAYGSGSQASAAVYTDAAVSLFWSSASRKQQPWFNATDACGSAARTTAPPLEAQSCSSSPADHHC